MLAKSKPPAADVTVVETPGHSFARENATRVEVDGLALFWPKMCCCCGSTTSLDVITIYGKIRFGGANAAIDIPYCRRCQSHYLSAVQRALGSAVRIPAIGFTLLVVLFSLGMLTDEFVAFFLQLLVVVGALVWGVRTYFVARAEIKNAFTPACSGGETPAVSFGRASPAGLRFRFCSREYAERFAAVNPGGSLTVLL
jgi:hypothetical protein